MAANDRASARTVEYDLLSVSCNQIFSQILPDNCVSHVRNIPRLPLANDEKVFRKK